MSDVSAAAMALTMLAAFVLILGGAKLVLKPETRTRGVLMIVAAAVLIGNVLIWTL